MSLSTVHGLFATISQEYLVLWCVGVVLVIAYKVFKLIHRANSAVD
jgi:hypothetical protein